MFTSSIKREIRHVHVARRSRAKTGREMYKKAWCTCKVVVLLIKPIVFLTFSLPSASLDLKGPNTPAVQAKLYLRTETISCRLLQRMARMDMH